MVFILHANAHKRPTKQSESYYNQIMGKEELKLIAFGFPFSEAIGMAYRLRRDGKLEEFIAEQEREYRQECEKIAQEAIG